MTNMEIIKQNILLILGLGAIALIRPVMKMTGLMDLIGQQFGSILMTVAISLVWLFIVVKKKCKYPVRILVYGGISYAIFAIILSGIMSLILLGQIQGPLMNPLAMASVIITNALWGMIIGGFVLAIRRIGIPL